MFNTFSKQSLAMQFAIVFLLTLAVGLTGVVGVVAVVLSGRGEEPAAEIQVAVEAADAQPAAVVTRSQAEAMGPAETLDAEQLVERRLLAQGLKIGEWPSISKAAQLDVASYWAVTLHPEDSKDACSFRVITYIVELDRAAKIAELDHFSVRDACVSADKGIAIEFAKAFRWE